MRYRSVGYWSYEPEEFDSVEAFLAWCKETHGEAPELVSSLVTAGRPGEWHQVGGSAPYSSRDDCDGDVVLVEIADEPYGSGPLR